MKLKKLVSLLAIAGFAAPALATDGYFAHGYGMTAKGMGGAATAMSKDSFGGANNPAAMVWAGERLDVGLDFFSPRRSAARTDSLAGINGSADSGSNMFYVPEFGYNKMMGANLSAGVTVYGNGGMNTNYPGGQIQGGPGTVCNSFNPGTAATRYNLLCGNNELGINMSQLIIAPTASMKVNQNHSFGVSLLFGYQQFAARGLQGFIGFTPNPATGGSNLTNLGYDDSTGYGLRLGWMGKVSESVTLGAAYSTKMKMGKFDKYKDLFAGQGAFDIPENFNLGIAVKATPAMTIAADYQRINIGDVNAPGNPSTYNSAFPGSANPPAPPGTVGSLGCNACRGFGWSNISVFKLGAEYQYNPNLVLRAGYNHSDNPIQARDVTFNIIAPGVVQNHLTLGFSYSLSKTSDLTMAYMHAYENSVTGKSLFNTWVTSTGGAPGGVGIAGNETIKMYQNSLGIAYGVKF